MDADDPVLGWAPSEEAAPAVATAGFVSLVPGSFVSACERCGRTLRSMRGLRIHQAWHRRQDAQRARDEVEWAGARRVAAAIDGWNAVRHARRFLAELADAADGVLAHATAPDAVTALSASTLSALAEMRDTARTAVAALEAVRPTQEG